MMRKFFINELLPALFISFTLIAVELGVFSFMDEHDEAERARRIRTEKWRDRNEVVAEYLRRQAIANANNSETATNQPTQNDAREDGSLSSPDKSMMQKETQAAARRHRDWHLQVKALRKRERASSEKLLALSYYRENLYAMLRVLLLLSPEQLDYARQALLKTQPATDVNTLFHAITTHPNTTTPERFEPNVQKLLMSREIYNIVRRELDIEWEALRRERKELVRDCSSEVGWVTFEWDDLEDAKRPRDELRESGAFGTIVSRTLVGTAAGATAGAAIGSMAGGLGALPGAVGGALACGIGGAAKGAHRYYRELSIAQAAVTEAARDSREAEQALAQCKAKYSEYSYHCPSCDTHWAFDTYDDFMNFSHEHE